MEKTVRKNAKRKLEEIFKNAKNGCDYSLDNCFSGESVSIEAIKEEFETFSFSKMTTDGNGSYNVRLHSNQWYTFESV